MADLLSVQKPVRYAGNEWNAVLAKPEARVRFAFAYPDVYEVGMSFLGLQIIYGLLNEQSWVWCERSFAPWPDMENSLRENNEYLSTKESNTPLKEMDIVGFSLQHEMMYTNVLTMLDLGGIPLERIDRSEHHPIIIAGGPASYNPMPMADFIDAFVIGEAEEVLIELCHKFDELKQNQYNRENILKELAQIEGVYVPSVYTSDVNRYGEECPLYPTSEEYPSLIEKRVITDFENSYYPTRQVVPNTTVIHHRLALEVMRGCPGGCRFCQAGYTDRPVRERSPERIMQDTQKGLQQTGFNEVGLLSLSTADYTQLPSLCSGLIQTYYPERVSLSLPSLRIDSFPARVTEEIGKVRSTGLTFAPEAGTERLRWAINKLIYDADIYAKVRESVSSNQDTVKFYFMVGLPTETDDDLQGIVDMVNNIKRILKEQGKNRAKIHVGLSPFVPKPHTAYQWYGQIPKDEIVRRIQFVSSQLKQVKGVKVNWHDPNKSLVEGALARGDKRLGTVIKHCYEKGGRFDEWGEYFSVRRWHEAFESQGFSLSDYATKTYEKDDILPWDLISVRIARRYLWREWEKTFRTKESRHCGNEMCRVCRVCDGDEIITVHASDNAPAPTSQYNMEHELVNELPLTAAQADQPQDYKARFRLCFSKSGHLVYASHHDLMMLFESLLRRAGIKIAFSEGFHPHPKIIFATAMPVGMETLKEYVDIITTQSYDADSLVEHLNAFCPEGLQIRSAMPLKVDAKKITSSVKAFRFAVFCSPDEPHGDQSKLIFETLNHPEMRDELKINDIKISHDNSNTYRIDYTCPVEGGKYTKPANVIDRLHSLLDLPLKMNKSMRLDMFMLSDEGNLTPLISSDHIKTNEKECNVE